MFENDTQRHKSEEPPSKEEMVYCGEQALNPASKDVEDGIDGTLTITDGERAATGARPGDQIWLRVQHGEKEVYARRKLHSTGRSVTLPLTSRKQIGLKPGDKIRYWIDLADVQRKDGQIGDSNSSGEDPDHDPYVLDEGDSGLVYHAVGDSENETVCGLDLTDRSVRRFSDPGDVLTFCSECNVRASKDMSNREIVEWLDDTIDGFELDHSKPNPSYFTKDQLAALRDHLLELREATQG